MEFLKALKEAERVGVSRQEFKKVWELQERLNTMRASTQRLWQGLGGNQDSQTGVQDLKAEMHQLKQEITKLRKDLVTRCVALDTGLSSNICQHNQDLEDIKNVLSQLKNEILRLKTLFNAHLEASERQILSSKNSLERQHTADMSDKRLDGYFVDTATQTCDDEQSEEGKIMGKAEQHSPELEPRQQQQLKEQHQQNDNQQRMEQQGKQWDDQGQCWKVIADIKTLLSQCHNTSENLDPKISSYYNSSDEPKDLELGVPVTATCDGSGASVEPKGEECDDDEEEERNDMKVEAHTCSTLEKGDSEVDVPVTVTCDDSSASVEAKSKEYDDADREETNDLKVKVHTSSMLGSENNDVDIPVTVTRDDCGASAEAKGKKYADDKKERNDLKAEAYTCNMLEIEGKAQQDCGDQNPQELQQKHAQRGGQISLPVRQHNQHQGAQKSEECHDQNSQELHEQQQGQESPPVRQQNQQQGAQTSKGDDRQLSHQGKEQQQNQETSASTSTWPVNEIKPWRSAHDIPFLPTDGIVFQFKNIGSSASEGTKLSTPFYHLTDCPVSVGLSIWFDHKGHLNTQVLISVLCSKPREGSRMFELYGDIKNTTSVKFTPLLYGESQIKMNKTSFAVIDGDVSLETSRGVYPDITLEELNRRGYVTDDSIFIDWVVISRKVTADTSKCFDT